MAAGIWSTGCFESQPAPSGRIVVVEWTPSDDTELMPGDPPAKLPVSPGPEPVEPSELDDVCDGVDDDSDGRIDEDVQRAAEACNQLDDDCDGIADEGLGLGQECTLAERGCGAVGIRECGERGEVVCAALPRLGHGDVLDGTCDDIDDDCDGRFDEDAPCNGCPAGTDVEPGRTVCIIGGSFTRGVARGAGGLVLEEPAHAVTLSRPFLMDATEVTVEQWAQHDPDGTHTPNDLECDRPLCPITKVSWFDAVAHANRRSAAEGLTPCYIMDCNDPGAGSGCGGEASCLGQFECRRVDHVEECEGYRLPTEAEWERAARTLADSARWCGEPLDEFEVCGMAFEAPANVGSLIASDLGLHDMLGNVGEWSADALHRYPDHIEHPDPRETITDFQVEPWNEMSMRGNWFGRPTNLCRATLRTGAEARMRASWIGFRLVRTVHGSAATPR